LTSWSTPSAVSAFSSRGAALRPSGERSLPPYLPTIAVIDSQSGSRTGVVGALLDGGASRLQLAAADVVRRGPRTRDKVLGTSLDP